MLYTNSGVLQLHADIATGQCILIFVRKLLLLDLHYVKIIRVRFTVYYNGPATRCTSFT